MERNIPSKHIRQKIGNNESEYFHKRIDHNISGKERTQQNHVQNIHKIITKDDRDQSTSQSKQTADEK